MSMGQGSTDTGAPANQGNGNGNTAPASQGGGGQGSGTQTGEPDYSLAAGFLERVAPEHRDIVAPYVKQWDAGVTRRFAELHSQYAPYEDLGDPETLASAVELMNALNSNPWQIYGILHENLMGQTPPWMDGQQGQPAPGQAPGQQFPQPGQQQFPQQGVPGQQGLPNQGPAGEFQLPPQVQERLDKQEQILLALAQHITSQRQSETEAEEDAQLEAFVENLHDEFGDFDDNAVLFAIYQGTKPEDAVKEYQSGIDQRVQTHLEKMGKIPPILGAGGGGGVPTGGAGVKDLSRKDTQSLVANVLAKAAQDRQ